MKKSKAYCGALIQATVLGNITCANPKGSCIMHDVKIREKLFKKMENNVDGIKNLKVKKSK